MKIRHIAMAVAVALGSSYAIADTSSAIRGRISNPQGEAAAGTKVIILHVPSGTSRTVVTNESGALLLPVCVLVVHTKLSLIQILTTTKPSTTSSCNWAIPTS